MTLRRHSEPVKTIALGHCEPRCPKAIDWPQKNLILGRCPECGKVDDFAWRIAAAVRILSNVEPASEGIQNPHGEVEKP